MFIETLSRSSLCEPVAAILSVAGSLVIAFNNGTQAIGFAAYLIASTMLAVFFFRRRYFWLTGQQVAFLVTATYGVISYL